MERIVYQELDAASVNFSPAGSSIASVVDDILRRCSQKGHKRMMHNDFQNLSGISWPVG